MNDMKGSSRRGIPSLLLAVVLLACCASPQPEPRAPVVAPERPDAPPPPPPLAEPSRTSDCKIMARELCFPSSAEACAALGCAPERCDVSYSDPPQVSCR